MKSSHDESKDDDETSEFTLSHALVEGHLPADEEIKFSIGSYKILSEIGKGGMGEVFLAYDPYCGRKIAIKRIRPDLLDYTRINSRFLKEAHITSQLTHPSIIPIYNIHKEGKAIYYTMPYVEGETLKQIIRKTRNQEKKGKKLDHIGGSIPALTRIFINICQAVAYAHSKKVLHRDLKPENVIVGQFGEVLILDWGLAKLLGEEEKGPESPKTKGKASGKGPISLSSITKVGKVVGTVSYMAPERALGHPSTYQTDIYSLGVILFQMLTLRFPFTRSSLEIFQKNFHKERFPDPTAMAPYRDVPRILARIAKKCLEPNPKDRYENVEELIRDLENYIEGRAEWSLVTTLDPRKKEDWEFQENVYIPEHIAIARTTEVSEWMSLMISTASFGDNIKVEAKVKFGESSHGLGFLISIPESAERQHLNDGYCLWLGSDINKSTKLMRSTVEVVHAPEIVLKRHEWYHVCIDKVDNIIHVFINDVLQFTYISHLPLVGTHVGLLSRDVDFEVEEFNVYGAGQNVVIKCLAVPDAFLAHKDYNTALIEYRRIGYSFPGRAEGREAMFRAGITLLEQAKSCKDHEEAQKYYDLALSEFEKLYRTPGAPLEYLGKALVYQALKEYDEEIKCFELGCRRYPKHPLLPILQEQIVSRMHETSRYHRKATYEFILLTVRLLKEVALGRHVRKLFRSLQNHWEPLPFFEEIPEDDPSTKENKMHKFATELAFWLGKPYVLEEIFEDTINAAHLSLVVICNTLIALLKLGSIHLAEKKWQQAKELFIEEDLPIDLSPLEDIHLLIQYAQNQDSTFVLDYLQSLKTLTFSSERALLHIMEQSLDNNDHTLTFAIHDAITKLGPSENTKVLFDSYKIWACLKMKKLEDASHILMSYPITYLSQESTLLHSLYGCWLRESEGQEISKIHFSGVLDVTYPRTWAILGHYLSASVHEQQRWYQRAFFWEKVQLHRLLALYHHCGEDTENAKKSEDTVKELMLTYQDVV